MHELLALVAGIETLGKRRLQHLQPAYLDHVQKRMVSYQDRLDTTAQLARYGVPLERI